MTLDFSRLKFSTKGLIAFVLSLGAFLQIPAIGNPVMAFGQHHPHIAAIIAAITATCTLLHNPTVEAFFGIKQTTTTDTLAVGDVSKTLTKTETITPVTASTDVIK